VSKDVLITRREGAVLVMVNNNPSARNAVGREFFEAATTALTAAEADPTIGAVVLTGAGEYFCAGGDLQQIAANRQLPAQARRERLDKLHGLVRALRDVTKPVIAAVEGGAAGAGLSLMLACDLIVSSREASYSAAYVKAGLSPDGGLTAFLSEFAARQLLTELCLTGDRVSAERLHALGAINRLVAPGEAEAEAIALGLRLAGGPMRALARIKSLAHSAYARFLDEQLEREAEAMITSQADAEAAEGIDAFLQKRPADFISLRLAETDKCRGTQDQR
jgi:enoyl-CoA hydratase/carnithine racemase